ncbi:glutathione S-transferase family protein [Terricaulis sp.]|uniref:glutathione S-transferase family protein n=1 Tax=Terricaulis sp. TaxID=2768686 RepID=UPI003784A908
MILIGQFDSPFVRRVGITLETYGIPYEHRPWAVFGDAECVAEINPLIRVPTLVLDDGLVLVETLAILDALDEQAGDDCVLMARSGPARRAALRVCAFAGGISDKAVALFYEQNFHEAPNAALLARIDAQLRRTLDMLNAERAAGGYVWWQGDALTHADIAVAATLRHLSETQLDRFRLADWPALARHCTQCEALPVFQKISQPFIFIRGKS